MKIRTKTYRSSFFIFTNGNMEQSWYTGEGMFGVPFRLIEELPAILNIYNSIGIHEHYWNSMSNSFFCKINGKIT
jgi:hypothetical protein